MKLFKIGLLIVALGFCSLLKAPKTYAEEIVGKSYIKLENSPAIYYINENHERQYFFSGWIFKCYQNDYTNVQTFSKTLDLDNLVPSAKIGAVAPTPGCGLVKSPASPSVYAFDVAGNRHKIKDEATAKRLYGTDWAKKVYDMPDFVLSLWPIGIVFDETTLLGNSQTPVGTETPNETEIWKPAAGTTWNWQLDSVPQSNFADVDVYDIDLFEASAADVKRLHDAGKKVICYVSVGSWENWRKDAGEFPKEILGADYDGWEGEKWLDIRSSKLRPLLQKRFDECAEKGFDGLEPDNIDGYDNETGFDISPSDQITFNKWIASEAHKRGLSIGLKNDPDQVETLEPYFDWALTEDCVPDGWCSDVEVFNYHNKAVFMTEYLDNDVNFDSICSDAKENRFSFILKNRSLDEYVKICR